MPRPWAGERPWRMQAKASARSRTPLIMYSACHNFCLAMQLRAWSAYSQPRPDDVQRLRWGRMSRLIRPSEHQAESWCQSSEFRAGDEGKIDLQSAWEQ